MIAALHGQVMGFVDQAILLDVNGVVYEVLMPLSSLQRLQENKDSHGKITVITYHYLQVTQSSATPVLVGFLNELERDFFLSFISVSGIGPRAAVKAMNTSIGQMAQAIDRGDIAFLKSLPGIGMQRAKEIVAKLQGKVGRFALMRDTVDVKETSEQGNLKEEALAVLMQLQYSKPEAQALIEQSLQRNTQVTTVEELLNEIYKQRIKA